MARPIRISAVSYSGPSPASSRGGIDLAPIAEIVMRVAHDHPDFIVLPEICACPVRPLDRAVREQASALPGPVTDELGRLAQHAHANLLVPLLERNQGRVYNAVPLVSRTGGLVGVYRKNFPTIGEMEAGITPGTDVPVLECDGVRVGIAVCFDLNFASVAARLDRGRAQVVFWPSMYWGGALLEDWSRRYGFTMVAAHAPESAIIDTGGRVIERRGLETLQVRAGRMPPWVTATINVDRELFHLDYNQEHFPAIRRKYGPDEVAIHVHQPEGFFTLESRAKGLSITEITREFHLEPLRDYLARAETIRAKTLAAASSEAPRRQSPSPRS